MDPEPRNPSSVPSQRSPHLTNRAQPPPNGKLNPLASRLYAGPAVSKGLGPSGSCPVVPRPPEGRAKVSTRRGAVLSTSPASKKVKGPGAVSSARQPSSEVHVSCFIGIIRESASKERQQGLS